MPKVKVRVQITRVVELDLPEGFPSEEALKDFQETIFFVDGGARLIEHIASQVALHEIDFVEGVGPVEARILDTYLDYTDTLP